MTEGRFEDLLAGLARESGAEAAVRATREPEGEADIFLLEGVAAGAALSNTPISRPAIDLLIAAEVSSRAFYEARLTHPIWPRGQSGVTIGIGYDVGTVSPATLAQDWDGEMEPAAIRQLEGACGVLGPAASALASRLHAVTVPYAQAERVFLRRSVPAFVARTERALPNTVLLGPDCLGALVSLAYNRGASFNAQGDRFREMRAIRDHMADRAFHLIPAELRAMKRLWQGDPNMKGVVLRREAEARLFEQGLAAIAPHALAIASQAPAIAPQAPASVPQAPASVPQAPAIAPHAPAIASQAPASVPQPPASVPKAMTEAVSQETAREGLFSWIGGWLNPIIAQPTRDRLMFPLPGAPQGDAALVRRDEDYVSIRVLSARVVNARRWTSLYHGAVHATCGMLYEGAGADRAERQSILAPDGFRDIDPKGEGKLLQVDRPLFGPMPYRGDLRLAIALFSIKSSDLAVPYLSLLSELSQTSSLGFLTAAQPFIGPLRKASDLLFGVSDASSLECGTVRGFEPLRAGIWVCMGATRAEIPDTSGFRLSPQDFRLLRDDGQPVEAYPYLVFEIVRQSQRDNWMEIPALKTAWDAITATLVGGRDDDARAAAKTFRRLCFAGGDLTSQDARRLADKADQKVAQTLGPAASAAPAVAGPGGMASERITPTEGAPEAVASSLRSLDLYESPAADATPPVPLGEDDHTDPDMPAAVPDAAMLEAIRPWRIAEALLTLRRQVDGRAPHRSTASDGAIGDAAHAARTSDHNPWVIDGAFGVVTAIDITNDPAHGCDAGALAETLRAGHDPRVKYVIWNRRIMSATVHPWEWRPYTGTNPHDKHMHVSVSSQKARYDSTAAWSL